MKIKFIILLTFILALQTDNIYSQWQTFYPANSRINFATVFTLNQNIVWAGGSYGTIVKSTNGGQNWLVCRLPDTTMHIYQICAVSDQVAWVSTTDLRRLFKTSNGGISWVQQYFTLDGIDGLTFFNANTGFIMDCKYLPTGDTAKMMITRDGGATWYKNVSSPVTTVLVNISSGAVDTNFIWLVDNNKCYTLTGGLNNQWQMHVIDTSNPYILGTSFVNLQTGFVAAGLTSPMKFYKTTNAGVNWNVLSTDSALGVNTLCFVPNTNMAFVNGQTEIRISRNGGLNWIHRVKYSYAIDSISMMYMDAFDTNSVWIPVNKGRLFKYNFNFIGIQPVSTEIPVDFKLFQNYPNPFNPVTNIRFSLPVESDFTIKVFDISGREVYSITDSKPAGKYVYKFDGSTIASGIYFYKILAGVFSDVKKMIVLK